MPEKLQRTLSLPGCIGLIVGLVVGASIFILVPSLASMTGPSLYLAYALSAIPTIFTGLYLIQLGGAMPVTGANYYAITRCISPAAGFISSVAAVVGMISTNCLVAWGFAQYVNESLPFIGVNWVAAGIVVFFGIINWFGIKLFEWLQIAMMLLLISAMLLFAGVGVFHVEPDYYTPMFPNGLSAFAMVIAIASFSWAGFVAITEVAGEVKNPRKNIPLAIVISIVIILFLYVMQTYVFVGTMQWDKASSAGPTALVRAAESFLPGWCVSFIIVAALMAMATTINAIILMSAREALAWSRDRVIPAVFSRINKRFKTPEATLLMITAASVAGVSFAADLEQYAVMVVFAVMVIQGLGATAVWRMPYLMPDLYQKSLFPINSFFRALIWFGCMTSFLLIFLFGWLSDFKTGILFLCILAISFAYWQWRKRFLKVQGIDLTSILREESASFTEELKDLA